MCHQGPSVVCLSIFPKKIQLQGYFIPFHFQACNTLHPSQALQHEGLRANPPYKKNSPCGVAQFQVSLSGNTPNHRDSRWNLKTWQDWCFLGNPWSCKFLPGKAQLVPVLVMVLPTWCHQHWAGASSPPHSSPGNGPRWCWMCNEPLSQSCWALHITQCIFPLTHLGFFFLPFHDLLPKSLC